MQLLKRFCIKHEWLQHPACFATIRCYAGNVLPLIQGTKSDKQSDSQIMPPPKAKGKKILFKLRKKTGFSMSKCKKALEQHHMDYDAAYKWLIEKAEDEALGATELASFDQKTFKKLRSGVISSKVSKDLAIMLEMSCQSDTLTRNEEFHRIVSAVAEAIFKEENLRDERGIIPDSISSYPGVNRYFLDSQYLINIGGNPTLKSLVAEGKAKLGETLLPRRCLVIHVQCNEDSLISTTNTSSKLSKTSSPRSSIHFGHYIHPIGVGSISRQLGRFGALVVYLKVDDSTSESSFSHVTFGRRLAQHIVGMNPKVAKEKDNSKNQENQDVPFAALLDQEFLMDPSLSVREYLSLNGVQIIDFVRFESGGK